MALHPAPAWLPAVLHRASDGAARRWLFQRGVSLHGHTRHSRETLDFIPRYAAGVPFAGPWLASEVERYRRKTGRQIHFARGFWTGPVDAVQAWRLETSQIEALDLAPVISLTDHDNLDAPLSIAEAPVSCEWTVPFRGTILHLGVHNLPRDSASDWLAAMTAFTAEPREARLAELLAAIHDFPASLVVLNHPLWALDGQYLRHCVAMLDFLRLHRQSIHSLEWNGIRPDRENKRIFQIGRELGLPVVSGGDRHGCEPNAVLNVTRASNFEAFAAGIRDGEQSDILVMPQYERPRHLRLIETMWDILREYPGDARQFWYDRVFYQQDDGAICPLSSCWEVRPPRIIRTFLGVMRTLESSSLRPFVQAAFQNQGE